MGSVADRFEPLRGIAKYNPDFWDDAEVKKYFIARRPLLDQLVRLIKAEPGDRPCQHHLLLGQRGMGKSTLLKRLAVAVGEDEELNRRWLALSFPEEQYNIAGLRELWLNCLDALGDRFERSGDHGAAQAVGRCVQALGGADANDCVNCIADGS